MLDSQFILNFYCRSSCFSVRNFSKKVKFLSTTIQAYVDSKILTAREIFCKIIYCGPLVAMAFSHFCNIVLCICSYFLPYDANKINGALLALHTKIFLKHANQTNVCSAAMVLPSRSSSFRMLGLYFSLHDTSL